MTQAEFINCVKSLFNIDSDLLPELTAFEFARFADDPVRYYIRASDEQADAIWREIEKRQRREPSINRESENG